MDDDWSKHFKYIFSFSKKPVKLMFQGKQYTYNSLNKKLLLSTTFFKQNFICMNCGECCKDYTLIWDNIYKKNINLKEEEIQVNGTNFNIYYIPKKTNNRKNYCQWCIKEGNKYKCINYEKRPMLSRMPPLCIENINIDKGNIIMKRKFKRIKCLSKKEKFNYNVFQNVDIPKIEMLANISESYGIKTYYRDISLFLRELSEESCKILAQRNNSINVKLLNASLDKWI